MDKSRLRYLRMILSSSFLRKEGDKWYIIKYAKFGSNELLINFEIDSVISNLLLKNGVYLTMYGYRNKLHPFQSNNKLMYNGLLSNKSRISKSFYKSQDWKDIKIIQRELSPLIREDSIDKILDI